MVEVALQVKEVSKVYTRRGASDVAALSDASLELERGTTFGIVGESGCGKSTLARILVGLEAPTTGELFLNGSLVDLKSKARTSTLARDIQLVFQDPFSSLDPRMTVDTTLREVLHVHHLHSLDVAGRVTELLSMVGLSRRFADRYPHELSGGQAQRVAIARALAVEPKILVLDEPTSALDVSVRAEIINLLVAIQAQLHLSYVFISHDLAMVRHVSDQIAVMYLGRVVERGSYDAVFDTPLHPYTKALGDAVVLPDPRREKARNAASSEPVQSTLERVDRGCPYAPRCAYVQDRCREEMPMLDEKRPGHFAACHFPLVS
jgi:oligopeptide/dipeptide ABC transporter ATP-binding protein